MFEIREINDKTEYDPLLISRQAPFTQAWFYGEWQETAGRKVRRFEIKKNSETFGFFQVIKYPLLLSYNFLYIPHGPVIKNFGEEEGVNKNFIGAFREKLVQIAEEENAVFAKFDSIEDLDKAPRKLAGRLNAAGNPSASAGFDFYFRKVPAYAYKAAYFQPKYEWLLDIEKSGEELLADMQSKCRYNIRLAESRGATVEIISDNFERYFEIFYDLLSKTSERGGFSLHSKSYYKNVFLNCEKNKNAFLAAAKYNEKIIAINFILIFGDVAYFVFGGSNDEFKNLMAPHLAHWRGIAEAKNRSCKIYNFGGVAAGDDYKEFEGITRFKKGFGGRLFEYSDSWDLVLKTFWYRLYDFKKRLWG
ncbi:peptidoglycan bridge formation glycyltransferase FemA/FemB family protein [Candidatus Azambacteria bacterium]|nr:peptidoglycan bridge formation glycyltransferase FemA/FemB family protein [Candidatus Azambacteria bacterium]